MEIQHKFKKAEIKFGYMWWEMAENSKYEEIFPSYSFDLNVNGTVLHFRRVDWERYRIWLGVGLLKKYFKDNQVVTIGRKGNQIYIRS